MILRLHDKLARRIGIRPIEASPLGANPFADWSSQIFRAGREDFILTLNTSVLYAVVIPARGIQSEVVFRSKMLAHLRALLLDDGFEFHVKRLIDAESDAVHYSRPFLRGVATAMSDLVELANHGIEFEEQGPDAVARQMNATPMAVLGQATPREAFRHLNFRD